MLVIEATLAQKLLRLSFDLEIFVLKYLSNMEFAVANSANLAPLSAF
jgi:hypothetical protein